ncbi:MAG: hypothetical protein HRT94_04835 [Alphaproteobacteria bacterium]|nr:hypothetical protein [Alphaproteobacteria bacterium]
MNQIDTNDLTQKALKQIRQLCNGNGIQSDAVQIASQDPEVITMEGLTHLEIDTKTHEEERVGKFEKGKFIQSPEAVEKTIVNAQNKIMKNDNSREFISKRILDRPDKGFALHGAEIELEELQEDYSTHVPCRTCGGQGAKTCGQCNGQRQEVCTQCHGRTMIPCRQCHGQGFSKNPDGSQKQCNYCFGQRQVSCPLCQKTGRIKCRACRATGHIKCDPCKGSGIFTHIVSVLPVVKTLFEMDRAELPDAVVGAFERNGPKLAARGHMEIEANLVSRKDGGSAIKYETSFPYADMVLRINGKPVKISAFGNKGKIIKVKPFLESLIKPGLDNLKRAAKNDGLVSGNIKKATHYRIISRAIALTATTQKKKALLELKKRYPIGIRTEALQALIILSDKAIGNVTRKPRYIGLAAGLILSGAIYAGLFLGGIYAQIAKGLTQPIEIATALGLVCLGGFMSLFAIKCAAKKSMSNAIGHLLLSGGRTKTSTKTRTSGVYAFLGSAIILVLVIEIARQSGQPIPSWYNF